MTSGPLDAATTGGDGLATEAARVAGAELVDQYQPRPVLSSQTLWRGAIWDVHGESVDLGTHGTVQRQFLHHPGAVTILALDDRDCVLLVRQYRHPVRSDLWELPAGLLDSPGESPLAAAQRELHEEADLTAGQWNVLIDWYNTPGGSNEAVRLFLARDLAPAAAQDRHRRTEEEAGLQAAWVPLTEAHVAVLTGRLHNPGAVIGILAAHGARDQQWRTLRPADCPWPQHHAYRTGGTHG